MEQIDAPVIDTPRWFEREFVRAPGATQIVFALYPDEADVEFAVTGTYIR